MINKSNKQKTVRFLVYLTMVLLFILFMPAAALAIPSEGPVVNQTLSLTGWHYWQLQQSLDSASDPNTGQSIPVDKVSAPISGTGKSDLKSGSVVSDTVERKVGETTRLTFDIDVSNNVIVRGTIRVDVSGVEGAVYMNTMDVYLEVDDGSGGWERFTDREGNPVKISVISERTPIEGSKEFTIDTIISVTPHAMQDLNPRWVSEVMIEGNANPSKEYQDIMEDGILWRSACTSTLNAVGITADSGLVLSNAKVDGADCALPAGPDEYNFNRELGDLDKATVTVDVTSVAEGTYKVTSVDLLGFDDELYPSVRDLTSEVIVPFNILPNTRISGHKFYDSNTNGKYEQGESRLDGWAIKLFAINGTSTESATLIDEKVTKDGGYYEFTGLPYGKYRVEEVQQGGKWHQSAPANPNYFTVTLTPEVKSFDNQDFGNYESGGGGGGDYGSISGHKFNDSNGNGVWDNDELAMGGWTINLSNGRTTTTDQNGDYSFSRLTLGTYTVEEVQQEGWTQSTPASGTFTVTIDSSHLNAGNLDFGNYIPSIPVPPIAGPQELILPPIAAPEVLVTPKRVPAGDPTITVKAGPDTQSVYAMLPDGRKLNLKQVKPGVWKESFLVPFKTPDGPYDIKVFAVNKDGRVGESRYNITIDNTLPVMKIRQKAQADGTYLMEIKPLFNAVGISYSPASGSKTVFKRSRGSSWWTAVVPAGEGTINAIDESGYEVTKPMSLAVIPTAVVDNGSVGEYLSTVTAPLAGISADQESESSTGAAYLLMLTVIAMVIAVIVLRANKKNYSKPE